MTLREQGRAAAYWDFGLPPQGTLAEYHLRAYGYTAPIPNETIRFIPECPCPRLGLRRPAIVAKIGDIRREFAGVSLHYLNPNRIHRHDADNTETDYIDWEYKNSGVYIGDPLREEATILRIASSLEDALVAHQNIGGRWVYDTSRDWSGQELPIGVTRVWNYRGFGIDATVPAELSGERQLEISQYRKLVISERRIVK